MNTFLKNILVISVCVLCTCTQPTSWFGQEQVDTKQIDEITILQNNIAQSEKMIVLFMTSACGYCRYILSIFNTIKAQYESQITFQIVNVSNDKQGYKTTFKFDTVPTVVYYKNGQEKLRHGSENKKITAEKMAQNIKQIYNF